MIRRNWTRFLFPTALTLAGLLATAGCDALLGEKGGGGGGAKQIANSGELTTEDEYDKALGDPVTTTEDAELTNTSTYECTTQEWGTSEIRDLTDRAALTNDSAIYPGGLIQGKNFEDGSFTPITIARAGGTIYMTGLALAANAEYSRKLKKISGSAVNQAIQDIILDEDVQGTAAEASFSVVQTFSSDHLFFSLGVDARYGAGDMSADLSMDTTSTKNYILMKFTQKYYDIVFEDPEKATSVFKDGSNFDDSENQIGEGNPPLYVSSVSYGRQVFFVAESEYTASEVKAALTAAYDGGAASGEIEANLTNEQVMSRTQLYYYVRGGDSGLALAPIGEGTTQASMYSAILEFLSGASAEFSAESPGIPIAYTLNYLKSREPAQMSYTVAYSKRDCRDTTPYQPSFKVKVWNVYHDVTVYLNDTYLGEWSPCCATDAGPGPSQTIDLSDNSHWLRDADNTVLVRLYLNGLFDYKIKVNLYKNGKTDDGGYSDSEGPTPGFGGERVRYTFVIDPVAGEVTPTQNVY